MQILTQLYYLIRSLVLRGPMGTILLTKGERRREKQLRIQTSGFQHSRSLINFHYQPASYKVLDRIFREIAGYAATHRFVDIGCGRGRVLVMAAETGFSNLLGIEINDVLLAEAQRNFDSYLSANPKKASCSFLGRNALDVDYGAERTVYFFFNPFNGEVLDKVVSQILERPHDAVFVYMNPRFSRIFRRQEIQEVKVIRTFLYVEARIYIRKKGSQILS